MIDLIGFSRVRQIPGFHSARQMVCIIMVIGFVVMSVSNSGMAEEATFKKKLEDATVLRTFDTKGAYIHRFDVANNTVAFTLLKDDSVFVAVCNIDGKELFQFGQPINSGVRIEGAELSPDGKTLIIQKYHGHEHWSQTIYNIDGTLRFELPHPALLPSPSGKYFCYTYDEVQHRSLAIFDSLGNKIKKFHRPLAWNCRFLGDDRLLVAGLDTTRIISSSTGEILHIFPQQLESHSKSFLPRVSISPFDSTIAVYSDKSMVVLSPDLKEQWRRDYDERLMTVVFNDQHPWMTLVFDVPRQSYGLIRVISTENPGIVLESDHLSALGRNAIRYFDVSWFSGQTISIWGPVSSDLWSQQRDVDYWTMFFNFDIESHVLSQPSQVPGLLRLVASEQRPQKYLRCIPNTGAAVLSVEGDKKETEK